ncbi:polyadenylate-binding protein-interacting protein 1 isoform X2 [Trichomycterus rosablanca]|uniref:polyadenylate-binding protein-interacting protein 1 isoform X2 n=1 Tax=Trichomycterus rosablanca TaxID=2290929 RepID=UPI002F360560
MSGDCEGFDRAPGAGRGRGKVSGPGLTDVNKPRQPQIGDGAAVFTQCEPLRQPRTPVPTSPITPTSPSVPPVPTVSTVPSAERTDSRKASTPSNSESSNSSTAAVKTQATQPVFHQSSLSASAPEFYPSTYLPAQDEYYEDYGYDEAGFDGYYPEMSLADLVQDILAHLDSSPGSFESEVEQIAATLNSWVTTEETLKELVELIFTQSTSMSNFTYTGARLCNVLSHRLVLSPASGNFRQLLLQRVEFEQKNKALEGDPETRRRFHTYVVFLGELYLNLEVRSGPPKGPPTRAEILLIALRELMDLLFSKPDDGNLICAVKLLKLTGSVLDDTWKERGKSDMDQLIQRMLNIVLDTSCSRHVKEMLLKLVELRSSNWGRVHAAAAYSEATPDTDPNYYMNEPTFYTADGTPFTAADPEYSEKYQEILDREDYFPEFFEENGNDALYADEDEMEPEIEEAFEKFCLETERKNS